MSDIADLIDDEAFPVSHIFIEPPEINEVSNEDSGPEDSGGTIENLSSGQLRATAELVTPFGQHIDNTLALSTSEPSLVFVFDSEVRVW